jgi:hypothetical protein
MLQLVWGGIIMELFDCQSTVFEHWRSRTEGELYKNAGVKVFNRRAHAHMEPSYIQTYDMQWHLDAWFKTPRNRYLGLVEREKHHEVRQPIIFRFIIFQTFVPSPSARFSSLPRYCISNIVSIGIESLQYSRFEVPCDIHSDSAHVYAVLTSKCVLSYSQ